MAFLVKNMPQRSAGPTTPGFGVVQQWLHVKRAGLLLPATGTEQIFRVHGGKVLVHKLVGTVTVVLDSTDPVLKVSSAALDAAEAAVVGTAVDVASTTNIASLEVGGTVTVLGSGAGVVKNNAGAGIATLGAIPWIAPAGEIYITTGGTNLTGFIQWDIWYQPLDEGANVTAVSTATAKI